MEIDNMHKQIIFKIKGMNRDLSESAFNPEFSYENHNISIAPSDSNTLMSVSNIKGNKAVLDSDSNAITLEGVPIGKAEIDNVLIVFSTTNSSDYIYKIYEEDTKIEEDTQTEEDKTEEDTKIKVIKLFEGNLNFNTKNPIETLSYYENDKLKKVYWTDGVNQPRFINIEADDSERGTWNNNSFDFSYTLKLREEFDIKRNSISNGTFPAGVIQYAFTYFNKYAAESNIIYTSPLFYTSYDDRGTSAEDSVNNSFSINIKNIDDSFDYLRIYSLIRTSINSTIIAKKVTDISLQKGTSEINFIDTNSYGENIDPYSLLYKGGDNIIFKTFTQKDGTLFLGNVELKRDLIPFDIKKEFKDLPLIFENDGKVVSKRPTVSGVYPYDSQLKLNSSEIKSFKFLETYRIGVQFQHYNGKWSEPIFIKDLENDKRINIESYSKTSTDKMPYIFHSLQDKPLISDQDKSLISEIVKMGYIKIRPMIVQSNIEDRTCLCQGILCPTVFNLEDRCNNNPYVQSSWFIRPMQALFGNSWGDRTSEITQNGIESINGHHYLDNVIVNNYSKELVNKGSHIPYLHSVPLEENVDRQAEIQCLDYFSQRQNFFIEKSVDTNELHEEIAKHKAMFGVDQSIVTLHSPELEFEDSYSNLNLNQYQLRIVGIVPLSAFAGDIDIQTKTPSNTYYNVYTEKDYKGLGFFHNPMKVNNCSRLGWRGLHSGAFWMDFPVGYNGQYLDGLTDSYESAFVVYPFHKTGSLINVADNTEYKPAVVENKVISNIKYSYNTYYFETPFNFYEKNNELKTGSRAYISNSKEVEILKLHPIINDSEEELHYYANVDKIIVPTEKYPIMVAYRKKLENGSTTDKPKYEDLFTRTYVPLEEDISPINHSIAPVEMKYKSSNHAVIAFNQAITREETIVDGVMLSPRLYGQVCLPSMSFGNTVLNKYPYKPTDIQNQKYLWDNDKKPYKVFQSEIIGDSFDIREKSDISTAVYNANLGNIGPEYGCLYLGELYNPDVQNRFGGTSEEAIENNIWIPSGKAELLVDENNKPLEKVELLWEEGDTYYQRYDHIKTYPYAEKNENGIVEIASFMCETRINLDGRYDRNRGKESNLYVSPINFNLLNKIYSQSNNYFNYRTINSNKLNLNKFTNTITWTKTKTVGELIDTWTNITLASTLDLDGDKGEIRALKRLNNNIIAFQDKGISHILYNENTQISTTQGVPIEIANSGKVQGKRYISNTIGCLNKWSICETTKGMYFIDDINKELFLFNGELNKLSSTLGFYSWIKNNNSLKTWNPETFDNITSFYDKTINEVLFIYNNTCLAYSELFNTFTSFYDYGGTPFMGNLNDKTIAIQKDLSEEDSKEEDLNEESSNLSEESSKYQLWLQHKGDYNKLYNKYYPFSITYLANPNPTTDKIFNNLEFRSTSYKPSKETINDTEMINETFDYLESWNEYQHGDLKLNNIINMPSSLKEKFRIWRTLMPRDKDNIMDRMRSPWLYFKLSKVNENTNRTILHDVILKYFE